MKVGLGLNKKFRKIFAYWNLIRFSFIKILIGFDLANIFLQRVDKNSLQLILRKNKATIGSNCDIETGLSFHNCKDYSNLKIGNNCHIGKNCFFDLRDEINIEDNCTISMRCTFITHQDMGFSKVGELYGKTYAKIHIGKSVYIATNVTVLQGVEIGSNALIAASSLVKDSVADSTVVGGVPAKFLKVVKFN